MSAISEYAINAISFPIGAKERLHQLIDAGTEPELLFNDLVTVDVLGFPDYQAKLARDAEKTDLNDSVVIHRAMIGGHRVILGIMDFGFLGAVWAP